MRAADPKRYVHSQYDGFLKVKDVAPDSTTKTFAAVELMVDNWRWSGGGSSIPAGKQHTGQVERGNRAVFRRPPLLGMSATARPKNRTS